MSISQLIYTSTCTSAMTPEKSFQLSEKSIKVCQELGLTGRVFANDTQALAITEGPTDIVRRYYEAVGSDDLVESILLHTDRIIPAREFKDYSVWLNITTPIPFVDNVYHLSEDSLRRALPQNISARLRIMIEAYLKPDLLVA
ncbi:BLUF domain-containing protein [Litorimonas sp. RW-G-Af-16]|uniref:BLUF domain-containing protein n=1 Tax=Litorimonas sp. RW-G-Af-16 TaxID=3241168 RepID=UPI00390C5DD9